MSTDRELLELAAKEAGIVGDVEEFYIHRSDKVPVLAIGTEDGGAWDPIHDDGDALRLAVKLGLAVDCFVPRWESEERLTMVLYGPRRKGFLTDRVEEIHGPDPFAATRRAIVRAAAEIGRTA